MNHPYGYNQCLTAPIPSACVFGTILAGLDVAQGARFTPGRVVTYAGGLWAYNAMQCPMEAIHGRQSLGQNVLAGGIMGYVGVSAGRLGVPFVDVMTFYKYPALRPNIAAFFIYGGLAGTMAALGGKEM